MDTKIMQYATSKLIAPDGCEVWTTAYDNRLNAMRSAQIPRGEYYDSLFKMCGSPTRATGEPWVNSTEIKKKAEELNFISQKGCAPGFFVRLPAATYLDRVTNAFNEEYFRHLAAVEITFPTVFDARATDSAELITSYESQGLMFRLDDRDKGLRLTYAADPCLFAWLRNTKLLTERLPYTIVSNTNIFRRHPGGKLGPLGKTREYKLQDMHRFVLAENAAASVLDIVKVNSDAIRYWVDGNFAQFADVTPDFLEEHPDFPAAMAKAANSYTMINVFKQQPRYYRMRSGLMADAGTGGIMLYNIQWDEENGPRYNITLTNGQHPVIIHFNALAGSGLLNTLLGRSLAGIAPKQIAGALNPSPVILLPVHEECREAADLHASRLKAAGVNCLVERPGKSLGKAIWSLRDRWQTAYAVIGPKEKQLPALVLSQGYEATPIAEEEFISRYIERMRRCGRGYLSPHTDLPFFVHPKTRQ